MARERIIEGTWNCTSCGAREIKARHKSCPGCGNPREETGAESNFDFGAASDAGGLTRESVTDAPALELAAAGADWFCAYCGAANRGDHPKCRTCSADRAEGRAPGPEPAATTAAALMAPAPRPRSVLPKLLIFGCALPMAVFITGFCGYIFWAIQTKDYEGTVTKVAWSRTVRRETFARALRQGWRDQLRTAQAVMPTNGRGEVPGVERLRDCHRKQRSTRQVPDGTERVCSTKTRRVSCGTEERCHTENLGNGFAKEVCHDVTKYCSESYEDCHDQTRYRTEPVYADECTYDTWEWKAADERTLNGTEDQPKWPSLDAGPLDRLVRSETYDVALEYRHKGKSQTTHYHPASIDEFDRWRPGTKAVLVVANDGTLKGFREGDKVRAIGP
jgi:hypothetical protein